VDAVVDLGKGALKAPIELQTAVFVLFKPLKFGDEIEFELGTEPRSKLERDVFVGVSATVSAGTGNEPLGPCQVDPLFGRKEEAILTSLGTVEIAHHVSERDVVALGPGHYADRCSLDGDGDLCGFTHFFSASKFPRSSPITTV